MLINKITHGWVTQTFDTDTQKFTKQSFSADDSQPYFETDDGEEVDREEFLNKFVKAMEKEPYLPFNMIQPEN